ncbi:MAG: hypothetical protein HQK84_00855 [Nitrospinae bacterium]|nr:hypothetical protein [Nitrospinota bacterium]
MKRKLDQSLETHLTNLMFKAISESKDLKGYLHQIEKEGKINQKSLLTFSLRPMALIKEKSNPIGLSDEAKEGPPQSNFNPISWLEKLRIKSPFNEA